MTVWTMKKLGQYLILAAILIGLPLACAWLAGDEVALRGAATFPPRTEDWGGDDGALWQRECPFTWWALVPMAILVAVALFPFVRRSIRAARSGSAVSRAATHGFPAWGWVGLVLFLGWLPVIWLAPAWARRLQVHSFAIMGFGHAMLMDALAYRRLGTSIVRKAVLPCLLLLPVSALYWWFFEFLNRFSRNWYFVNLENFTAFEYVVCFSLGCATILPSAVTTARWLGTFDCFSDRVCEGFWRWDVGSRLSRTVLGAVSIVGLVGVVFVPSLAFPFLWLSPICVFVLVRGAFGERTELAALRTGNWSLVWRWAVAMLICGIVWETWGFWLEVKWVYSVPYLHRFCYAEMPVIGFAGYLPFGVEALLVCGWLGRLTGVDDREGGCRRMVSAPGDGRTDRFEERVRQIVVDGLGVSPDEVTRDASFRDLGAEAFDIIELIMAFEEEMGFAIPEEESEKLTTFGKAVDYLRKKSRRG